MMVNPKIELPKGGVTLNYAFWNRCNGANLSVKIFANLDYFVYCIKKKKNNFHFGRKHLFLPYSYLRVFHYLTEIFD